MVLIAQGKSPVVNDNSFRDIEENEDNPRQSFIINIQ